MAEAVALVGLVASIITLIDLAEKIVSRINDFTTRSSDIPRSFHLLADRLPLLTHSLQHIQTRAHSGRLPDAAAKNLKTLVDSLNVQIEWFEQCLKKCIPAADASLLKRGIQGLQSLTKDEQVTQSVEKIHKGIDVLVLYQGTVNIDLSERILQQTSDDGDRILRELADLKLGKSAPQQAFGLCLFQAPLIDPDAFLGRTAELQQLDCWLTPTNNVQSQKVVSIVGMGGLGKTQLSLAYASQHGSQFSSVFWLNAADSFSLQQSFLSLSNVVFSNPPAGSSNFDEINARIQRVKEWLSEPWNQQWLLIFDNYDDPALPNVRSSTGFDIRTFFPVRAQGSIIITTRSPKLAFSKQLKLEKLTNKVAVDVLSRRAERDLGDDIDAERLTVRLNGLPLALATAGTYIGQTATSCAEYLDTYEALWGDLHGPESESLLEYADRTLSSTWTMSLDCVSRQDPDAADLLRFSALLSNDDIWYELVRAGATNGPAWMARVTATKLRFDRAIIKLQDYSLVEVIPSSYRVHPCVHDWLLEQYQHTSNNSWFYAALSCVTESILNHEDPQYWTAGRRLIRHVQRLDHQRLQNLWDSGSSEERRRMLDMSQLLAYLYQNLCHFQKAEQMYKRVLTGKERLLGMDHPSTLDTVSGLGTIYRDERKLAEAERMLTRVLVGRTSALGTEHKSTLNAMTSLGSVFSDQGKFSQAEQMYTQALAGKEKVLGAEDASTLNTVVNLGTLYSFQDKLVEAEQMYTRALSGYEKAFGPEHVGTLGVMNQLGILYNGQDKFVKAEQMYTRALAGREKILGAKHASTLQTMRNFGKLYSYQGKLADAERMFTRGLAGSEELLGVKHPLTLGMANGLGFVYSMQGKLSKAELMHRRALVGYEAAFGTEHWFTLGVVTDIGGLYYRQRKPTEAESMYIRALAGYKKTVGMEHTSTAVAMNNLALLYVTQGKLIEAEQLYTQTLAVHEKVFGAEHRATITTTYNLGLFYSDQGRFFEAEQLLLRTLAASEKVLGSDHERTLGAARRLSVNYFCQGRLAEAEQMSARSQAGHDNSQQESSVKPQ